MITIIGSINLDLFANSDRLPLPGETIAGTSFSTAAGGKGANQALAALRAGADMRMVGAVGNDSFAQDAIAELKKDGANLSAVKICEGATGVAIILVGGTGENVIVVVPGANGTVDPEMAHSALADMTNADMLVLQQEVPTAAIEAACHAAREKHITTLLNIAPFTKDSPKLAAMVDILVANETEFADLLDGEILSGDALNAAISLRAKSIGQTIIVTLGAQGVVAATKDGTLTQIPAPKITPVDTVGAGDTFCGYFATALNAGDNLNTALIRAATAGSLACLKPGAQPAIPYKSEVDAALSNPSK